MPVAESRCYKKEIKKRSFLERFLYNNKKKKPKKIKWNYLPNPVAESRRTYKKEVKKRLERFLYNKKSKLPKSPAEIRCYKKRIAEIPVATKEEKNAKLNLEFFLKKRSLIIPYPIFDLINLNF